MEYTPIDQLSNYELARVFMRRVWNSYDVGGISMRRSMRAALLEAVLPFCPFVDRNINLDWRKFVPIEEALQRPVGRQLLLFDEESIALEAVTDQTIVLLLLQHLYQWYLEHENSERICNIEEKRLIGAVLHLLGLPCKYPVFDWEEVLLEAEDRYRERIMKQYYPHGH